MSTEKIERLVVGAVLGLLNEAEEAELQAWLEQSPKHRDLYEKILSDRNFTERYARYQRIDSSQAYHSFRKRVGPDLRVRFRPYLKYAACLLIFLVLAGITTHLIVTRHTETQVLNTNRTQQALLILDDGTNIPLHQSASTSHLLRSSIPANATDSGIVYQQKRSGGQIKFNTLVTPRGGEYTVILSDGTKVHLNSSSELRYPVAFSHDSREVFLKGEAYFTVSRDTERPFIVHADDVKVRQYGTSFNINTYHPGKIQIVLVKGDIGVSASGSESEQRMVPSQLAEYQQDIGHLNIRTVNIHQYVSWHEGQLVFDNMKLRDMAVTLSNWYDVDIIIDDPQLQDLHFTGSVNRSEPVKDILEAIRQAIGVTITVRNKSIYIYKQ